MGLSNEERLNRLYSGVDALHERLGELDKSKVTYSLEEPLARLRRAVDGLWFALLGENRNNGYWLFGGDATDDVKEPSGAFSAAVLHLCDLSRSREHTLDLDPLHDHLSVKALLGAADPFHRAVYEMFQISESMAYGLRRYDDDFRASFKALDKLIADLQGACHSIFRADEVYAKAYVLHRTLSWMYGSDPKDPVRAFLTRDHAHHDLSRPMTDGSLKEVLAFDEWTAKTKRTPENRILLMLRIAGRRFHYKHKYQDMMKALDEVIPQNRRKAMATEFDRCVKAHENRDTNKLDEYRASQDLQTRIAIHGYEAADWKP